MTHAAAQRRQFPPPNWVTAANDASRTFGYSGCTRIFAWFGHRLVAGTWDGASRLSRQWAGEKAFVAMTTFQELVWAGGALCCVLFALDISMPPDQGDADQATIIRAAAHESPVERDAGTVTAGSPPATEEETHNAQAGTAAVVAPSTTQAFASVENSPDQKHAQQKRDGRRTRPKSAGPRYATAQPAPPRTWNDNSWSWNQSWQGQSDRAFRSGSVSQSPGRGAGNFSGSTWNFDRPRSGPSNGCPWC